MRPFALLVIVLATLALASGAGARETNSGYVHFYVHMNAYAHWGKGCTDGKGDNVTWESKTGTCHGTIEEGKFLDHKFVHSTAVYWHWNGDWLYVSGPGFELSGSKPHNWFTFQVDSAKIDGVEYSSALTGTAAAGDVGGALFVNLGSHRWVNPGEVKRREGQSMDLKGYLRRK